MPAPLSIAGLILSDSFVCVGLPRRSLACPERSRRGEGGSACPELVEGRQTILLPGEAEGGAVADLIGKTEFYHDILILEA